MAQIKIENLSFTYPQAKANSLDNINLQIDQGEYITICGRSGSGKTTLLHHLKTVLTPHGEREGKIFYGQRELSDLSLREQSSMIGFVMQNPDQQIVTDKVWHELAFGLESLGCDTTSMRLRVAEMASYFGIQNWFHRDVNELSGGQKQLLNLASIMAMQPSLLILDEPTSQLDPIAAADFLNTVRKINLELGTTVILTEHRLEEVFSVADRVLIMEQGKILIDANPRHIGAKLFARNSDLIALLPTPVQVFYHLKGKDECPLTVREGRNWLNRQLPAEIKCSSLPQSSYIEPKDKAINMKNIWFRYTKDSPDILKGVNFNVRMGSITAVVGGNATGKSTLLKAVSGIVRPYSGDIKILGKSIKKYKGNELYQNCIAMLPQDPESIFVKTTVAGELKEMLPHHGQLIENIDNIVSKVVELCELAEIMDAHPYDLSGGEKQRVALAKVLLLEPKILILDEPTKGIDNLFKKKLAAMLKGLTEQGVTILMVSHDVEFCAQYADDIAMIFDGKIIAVNTSRQFFARNNFYTTSANRMSRHVFPNAITGKDVVELVTLNQII
ncbi:MAG TPA: energy-coupling factor ABC transporter ATP-binding protein [Clostridiaceae bacterium]|nr:energy-coupling factor ABC transporter ATP-binding protein [Clostridiaceae bacterium]